MIKQLRIKDYILIDELTANFEVPEGGYKNGDAFGHFAFGVESMDEFTKKLHSLGYEYLYEPFYMHEAGSKIAFIKDPDNKVKNLIFHLIHDISSAIILYSPAQKKYIPHRDLKKTFIAYNTLSFSNAVFCVQGFIIAII